MRKLVEWFTIPLPANHTDCDVELSEQYANREIICFSILAALSITTLFSISCACYSRFGCSSCCRRNPAADRSSNNRDSVTYNVREGVARLPGTSVDAQNHSSTSGSAAANTFEDLYLPMSEPEPLTASAMTTNTHITCSECKCAIVKGFLECAYANFQHKPGCDPKKRKIRFVMNTYSCCQHIPDSLLNDGVQVILPNLSSGKSPRKSTKLPPTKSTSGQSESGHDNSKEESRLSVSFEKDEE